VAGQYTLERLLQFFEIVVNGWNDNGNVIGPKGRFGRYRYGLVTPMADGMYNKT
jgi:hypothetical protein